HGAYVSDIEVQRVVNFIKRQGAPQYDSEILEICEKALEEENSSSMSAAGGVSEYDEFYDRAVQLVRDKGQASTSMIQRAFRIGYNRAARIIDVMEQEGLVGPMDGVKPREVLIRTGTDADF
ncbi:MAG: cell division protein FtsK, partial [Deltaproteobacteria bacterium]|nr:cell division protein FtsK [Deltaproteobacteria bacterium]